MTAPRSARNGSAVSRIVDRFNLANPTRIRLIAGLLLIVGLGIMIMPPYVGFTAQWEKLLCTLLGGLLAGIAAGALVSTTTWAKNQRRKRRDLQSGES
jgi:hypothetical protein